MVPAEVLTSIDEGMVDGLTIAALVLVALVALYAFKLIRQHFTGPGDVSQFSYLYDDDDPGPGPRY